MNTQAPASGAWQNMRGQLYGTRPIGESGDQLSIEAPASTPDPAATPVHAGMSVLLVDAATAGFEVVRDLPKLGYHGPETCELVFDEARVPAGALLGGTEGRGLQQVLAALETGRINVAARAVGVAQEAYDQALRYAGEREAFGQRISGFQAVQLKLADMAMKLQAARLLVYWAAARADSGQRSDLESGMAKVYASEVAMECAATAMQVHGGYGYSREFTVERLYRDAPLMVIGEGTNDILRTVIARSLTSGRMAPSATILVSWAWQSLISWGFLLWYRPQCRPTIE
jgi:alkylation response protein AidB-like acyl-CoA dehydrogenase